MSRLADECQTPPCPITDPPPHNKAWANKWRHHVAQGYHSDEREEIVAFIREAERLFRKAVPGGNWDGEPHEGSDREDE